MRPNLFMEIDYVVSQCVGIDVSKEKLVATMCMFSLAEQAVYSRATEFENSKTGFNQLVKWSRKEAMKDLPLRFVMEATGVTVIAETNGFALIQNRNQLTSYAGFDIKDNQSGTVEGKSRISKRGNTRIRAILYMPAVQCQRRSKHLKDAYDRIVAKHPDKKMIAVTAMQRRLLLLIYAIWKSNKAYSEDYNKE